MQNLNYDLIHLELKCLSLILILIHFDLPQIRRACLLPFQTTVNGFSADVSNALRVEAQLREMGDKKLAGRPRHGHSRPPP